jgi:cell division protease FtsH
MYYKRAFLAIASFLTFMTNADSGMLFMSPLAYGVSRAVRRRQTKKKNQQQTQGPKLQATTKDGEMINLVQEEPIIGFPAEVADIMEFLHNPEPFHRFGVKMPKGVLFVGPPGTGKTSMARAIARESGAEFITVSGSEFVNMYVGVGASNVRKLFEKARNSIRAGAKSVIIFIDEIDALGTRAGTENSGGASEYNQTLNQLLTEMDGFKREENILVIAATNREDVLDEALLRPGRFDRRAYFHLPEVEDRMKILKQYCKNRPIDEAVNFDELAKKSYGMSGADLKNIINEASIEAAREKGNNHISQRHFDIALAKAEQRRESLNRRSIRR